MPVTEQMQLKGIPENLFKVKKDAIVTKKKAIVPKQVSSPVKSYTVNIGRGNPHNKMWEHPEWDLSECNRILDTESFIRRAFRNKKNLFLKEGYSFVGSDPERIKYIKTRLQQIEIASGIPTELLIDQTVSSLVRLSNAFWVKVRNEKASGGRIRKTPDETELKPVAAYFPMPAETVRFKIDEYGKILEYQQEISGKQVREFPPEDVIHFYFDKREGLSVGTPTLVPVKDDIRALRRIEENVELLIYQHLFPLFHYQVGTDKDPASVYSDGTDEVEAVRIAVANMPSDGCWVTPERHTVKAITTSSAPVAVEKVIEHFKRRIFTGIGQSSIDMGEGDNASRSNGQTMSQNLIQDTKADQKIFATMFEYFVIRELLLESTYPDESLFDIQKRVFLRFNEIDLEARQAKENHLVDMFTKNAVTHDEMRTGMGYEPFDGTGWPSGGAGDFQNTNYGLFQRDTIVLQSLDEPGTPSSKAEASSRTSANTAKKSSTGGNSISNKNQPQNQHGTRASAKVNKDKRILDNKLATDSFVGPPGVPSLDIIFSSDPPLRTMYNMLREDLDKLIRSRGLRMSEVEFLINSAFGQANDRLSNISKRAYRIGLQDSGIQPWQINSSSQDTKIQFHVERFISKLRKELIKQIKNNTIKSPLFNNEDALFVSLILKSLYHRTEMIDNSEIMRAYNYGKLYGYKKNDIKDIIVKRHGNEPCTVCDEHVLNYENTDDIIYEELLPLHPHCTCTIGIKG